MEEFLTFGDCLYPDGWILEQDGAKPHTARNTENFFKVTSLQILRSPPNSPDLNPFENVYQILKDYVEKKNPKNDSELISYIIESEKTITRDVQSV